MRRRISNRSGRMKIRHATKSSSKLSFARAEVAPRRLSRKAIALAHQCARYSALACLCD